MLLFVTAVAVVLTVSFLCSIFESVLLSLTRPQVEVMIRDGKRAGNLLADFKSNMDVPIAAILILNTAAHTIGAAVAGASYSNVFDASTLWIFSILFTLAVLLFTEIIPKTLGVTYATLLAVPVAHGINWLSRILKPLVVVSEKMSRSLRGNIEMPVTTPEEIRLLALLGRSEGVVGPRTAGMIVGATQIRHLQAHDVMLPRERVKFLSASMRRADVMRILQETGHSRFPFSPTGEVDDISGMVLAKELLHWLLTHEGDDIDWDAVRGDVLVVPESVHLPQLLRTYQESHRHLAVVVDEYGSVEGIATLEDVLEEIVGDIRDESDLPADDIRVEPDGSLLVRGSVDLRRLCAKLGVPWEPESDVTTVAGLVSERLERIPRVGDSIAWNGQRIRVLRADRRRARVLSITPDAGTG
ncbi:MAG: hemolysin family protein [Woeseiaceae bacterium]|nr:hemolysin family protein [Woeseiaceae bacterium]